MANIQHWLPFLSKWEGGLADVKGDRGGLTNKGVTLETFRTLGPRLGISIAPHKTPEDALRNLTRSQWELFAGHYWRAVGADRINDQAVAEFLADFGWHSGPGTAVKTIQQVLNRQFGASLAEDGQIGPNTLTAINAQDPQALFTALFTARNLFYQNIVARDLGQSKFLTGWRNRINDHQRQLQPGKADAAPASSGPPADSSTPPAEQKKSGWGT